MAHETLISTTLSKSSNGPLRRIDVLPSVHRRRRRSVAGRFVWWKNDESGFLSV